MDPFVAFSYSWQVDEEDGTVHIFALSPEDRSIHLQVSGFTPYTYMELPENIEWNEPRKQAVLNALNELSGDIQPVLKSFMSKKRLYQANVTKVEGKYEYKTFPYLFLAFRTKTAMFEFIKKVRYGLYIASLGRKVKFRFHEQDASVPLQLTCCRKLLMTGWMVGKGTLVLDKNQKYSSCDAEYHVRWNDLGPCTDPETLKKSPSPRVLMFDCEANSANISTMPKNRPDDKIFQISFAVMRCGETLPDGRPKITKYLLSLGNPDQKIVGADVQLHTYRTEGDLLIGMTELIHQIDPQIIGGYNIIGWDFSYLMQRAKLTGVYTEFTKMGYLVGVQAKERKINWTSSAFNAQKFMYLDVPGRLIIDMLPIIRRDFKFSRYNLDSVTEEILKQTKDPLTHKGIFKCYRIGSPESLAIVGKYCVRDSEVTLLLFDKLKTWIGSCQMSATFGVSIIDLYTQGQQLKIYSQVYRDCLDKNIVVEKDGYEAGDDETYTGAIVLDPVPGLYEDVMTVDFASLYPSVIIAENICYSTFVTDPTIPDEDCNIHIWHDHYGCEHDKTVRTTKVKKITCKPRKFRYLKKPVGVIPGILINLIKQRKLTKNELEKTESTAKEEKDPSVKKELSMYAAVLDMRQLSLKVSANSMYGGMGVRKGKLPFMPGAMCTTAKGREALMTAKRIMTEKFPGKVVYGDTDSLMYVFDNLKDFKDANGVTDYKRLEEFSQRAASEVSKAFPPPMKLEFENISKKFFILTKKRYMGELTNGKFKKKGIMTTRRDNAPICRDIYEGMMKYVLTDKSQAEMEAYVLDSLNQICSHRNPTKGYCITKSIKEVDEYKTKAPSTDPVKRAAQFRNKFLDSTVNSEVEYLVRSLPAHVQLAEKMRRRGMFVEAGSRIDFIVTTAGGPKGKMWQKIESAEYYRDHTGLLRLDMCYYVKSLVNPGDQVLEVRYGMKKFFKEQLALRLLKNQCLEELRDYFKTEVVVE